MDSVVSLIGSLVGGDLNGHVDRTSRGYEDVHGGYGVGEEYVDCKTILDLINDGVLFVASIDSCNRPYLLGKSLVVVIMMHL